MSILDFRDKLSASSYVSNITMHVYVINKRNTSICMHECAVEEVSYIYLLICYMYSICAIWVYT